MPCWEIMKTWTLGYQDLLSPLRRVMAKDLLSIDVVSGGLCDFFIMSGHVYSCMIPSFLTITSKVGTNITTIIQMRTLRLAREAE